MAVPVASVHPAGSATRQLDFLRFAGAVVNQQRHVQPFARCDRHLGADQVSDMPDIVRRAELLVEGPRPAQLNRDPRLLRRRIAMNACEWNRRGLDTFENISGDGAFHKRFSEDNTDGLQEIFEIALGQCFCRCLPGIALR